MRQGYNGNAGNSNDGMKKQCQQQERYCTECGCRLVSDSQFDKCDDCRRREADRFKKGLMVAGSVALGFLTVAAKLIGGSSKNKN